MPRLLLFAAIFIALLTPPLAEATEPNTQIQPPAGDVGFQPVDLNTVEKVNGKSLATVAYGIIFVVFVLYAASLLRRERSVEQDTLKLRQLLDQKK